MGWVLSNFDPCRPGYNTLVLGRSGSGKTVSVQAGISGLSPEVGCYVVDAEGEYSGLALSKGGEVFSRVGVDLPGTGVNVLDLSGESPEVRAGEAARLARSFWELAEGEARSGLSLQPRLLVVDFTQKLC